MNTRHLFAGTFAAVFFTLVTAHGGEKCLKTEQAIVEAVPSASSSAVASTKSARDCRVEELADLFVSFGHKTEIVVLKKRSMEVALGAILATERLGPVFGGDKGVDKTERLLVRMAYLESRGDYKAENKSGDSGILQVRGMTTEERALALSSPTEGMVAGLKRLHTVKKSCGGNALRWLGMYASGTCGGAPMVARERCKPVDVCSST